jgi:hypothetical protein
MKKFSRITESVNLKILDWSPNDILEELKNIPNLKFEYLYTHLISGDDMTSLEDFEKNPEAWTGEEFNFQYSFGIRSKNPNLEFNLVNRIFRDGNELSTDTEIPLSDIVNLFNDIESGISHLRDNFYIHLYFGEDSRVNFSDLIIDFTYRDSIELEYILKNK